MFSQGNIVGGAVHSGMCPLGKCPVVKASVKELFFRKVSVWDLSIEKSQLRKCLNTIVSAKFFLQRTALKSSKKEQ